VNARNPPSGFGNSAIPWLPAAACRSMGTGCLSVKWVAPIEVIIPSAIAKTVRTTNFKVIALWVIAELSFRNQDRNLRSHRRLVLCVTGTKRRNARDEIQNYRNRGNFACTRGSGNGRYCSLIPGLGVKLSNDRPCRAHCSLRGRGEPSA